MSMSLDWFRRLPVAGKLLAVSAVAIISLLLLGFSLVIWQAHSVVSEISEQSAFEDTKANANAVARDLSQIKSTSQAVAIAMSNSYDRGPSRPGMIRELRTYLGTSPLQFGVWHMAAPDAIDSDAANSRAPGSSQAGHFMPYWLRPGGQVTLDPIAAEVDYTQDYYKRPIEDGKATLVEPYDYEVNGTTYTLTSIAFPVEHDSRRVGVVGVDMALNEITDALAKVHPFGVGQLMLVSQAGNWLANPDKTKRMKPYADAGKDVIDKVLKEGKAASFPLIVDGTAMIRFVEPVIIPGVDARWAVIAQIPASAIAAPAASLGWKLILCGVFVLLGLLAALWWGVRKIVGEPVRRLSDTVDRLAKGEELAVPELDRADEIGRLARASDVFRQAAADRAAADARNAEDQARVTQGIGDALMALRDGDLTQDIRVEFPAAYESLKGNFNEALGSLRTLIGQVSESASSIRTGAGEIAQASEDLARRTESNAASLEETSAAVSQMDERLKTTARAAEDTLKRANGTMGVVSDGRGIAGEAVEAMGRVSDSAKGIDNVIEGLDKIAFQTRVLAMNAAVEAGRAGEAGKGFAVVADLVSALAMRAEEEAQTARDQLTATQADIVSAVQAVERVDGALANISDDVTEVHSLLDRIATDNQVQSSAVTEISAAVSSMDQAVQQNAAMVEETSAAARNLTVEVNSLADRAATFKVDGASAPTARPAPAKSVKLPTMPAGVLNGKTNGHANGHAAHDDWTAF